MTYPGPTTDQPHTSAIRPQEHEGAEPGLETQTPVGLGALGFPLVRVTSSGHIVALNRAFADALDTQDPETLRGRKLNQLLPLPDPFPGWARRASQNEPVGPLSCRVQVPGLEDPCELTLLPARSPSPDHVRLIDGVLRPVGRPGARREGLRELEMFIASVCHDLGEPLRTIEGHVGILEERLAGVDDPEVPSLLEVISSGTQRLDARIQDLTSYARLGSVQPRIEPVGLQEVIDDVLASLDGHPRFHEARIRVQATGVKVDADREMLHRVLSNLVTNALKYAATPTPAIELQGHEEHDGTVIEVLDNGPGIPETQRARAFEPFERLDAGPSTEGTGMGLAICRRIAQGHGGSIGVGEAPGGGARFWVQFPNAP